jgi:hypothetical protein
MSWSGLLLHSTQYAPMKMGTSSATAVPCIIWDTLPTGIRFWHNAGNWETFGTMWEGFETVR